LEALHQRPGLRRVVVRQQEGELVAAEARGEVRLAHVDRQVLCDHRDGAIAHLVPIAVVDPLEVVHVQHHRAQRVAVAVGALQLVLESLGESAVVGQPGERVGLGALLQSPLPLPGDDSPRHPRPDLRRAHARVDVLAPGVERGHRVGLVVFRLQNQPGDAPHLRFGARALERRRRHRAAGRAAQHQQIGLRRLHPGGSLLHGAEPGEGRLGVEKSTRAQQLVPGPCDPNARSQGLFRLREHATL
jgi:hypothetical protein